MRPACLPRRPPSAANSRRHRPPGSQPAAGPLAPRSWSDIRACFVRSECWREGAEGSVLGRDEHIADTAHGSDRLGMGGVDLDFAAQGGAVTERADPEILPCEV